MPLYDQFGREVKPAARPDNATYTVRLREYFSSYPSAGLTPSRLSGILKEADRGDVRRQSELYEEIEEKDPYIASLFQTRKLAVQNLEREILPADDSRQARRAADLCTEVLEDIDMDEVLLDMLDAIPKGFSSHEIVWDVQGGAAGIKSLEWIHPKYHTFALPHDPWYTSTPRIITRDAQVWGEEPAPWKIMHHSYKARSGYPSRMGVLRTVAWIYLFKNYAIKDWVGFIEVFAVPLRVGKYAPGASPSDKEALKTGLAMLGTDAAAIISEATSIEFPEAQKYGTVNVFDRFMAWADNQEAYAVLGQTLTSQASGAGGSGSRALGQVHNQVRGDLNEADAKAAMKTIRNHLLRPIVGFNLGWDAPVPEMKLHYEPPEDLLSTADLYGKVVDMGYPVGLDHVEDRFGIPRAKEGEPTLKPRGSMGPGPGNVSSLPFLGKDITASEWVSLDRVQAEEPMLAAIARESADADEFISRGMDFGYRQGYKPTRHHFMDRLSRVQVCFFGRDGKPLIAKESGQGQVDQVADQGAQGSPADAMLEPVRDLVNSAASYEDILKGLYSAYPDMGTKAIENLLHRALVMADAAGQLEAAPEGPEAKNAGGEEDA